jgi:small conductance mechanosensitive channel
VPEDFLDNLAEVGVRVLIAAAVLVVGRILAGLGRWAVDRLTSRPKAAKNLGPTMRKFLGQALFGVIMLMALVIALAALGVPQNVLLWGVGIVLVVLAVALSRSLGNLAATVLFIIFRPFQLGDDIETMGVRGVVEDLQLFNTVIRRFDHAVVSLPNGAIQEAGVVNHSRSGVAWAAVDVTVSYGQDLAAIRETILEVVSEDERVLDVPPPDVAVVRLGTEGVVMQAQPTVRHEDYWPALSELQQKITARLDEKGVSVAVPPEIPIRIEEGATRPSPPGSGGTPPWS